MRATAAERSCPGHCCRTLYLPGSLDQIEALADTLLDGRQILGMIEPTGQATIRAGKVIQHHYTCTNWDPDTQLCRDYENRPFMCRDYPHGEACEHCGLVDGISLHERLKIERAKRLELS